MSLNSDKCDVFAVLSSMEREALLEILPAMREEEELWKAVVSYAQIRPLHLQGVHNFMLHVHVHVRCMYTCIIMYVTWQSVLEGMAVSAGIYNPCP